jgi:hypothetical protein
MQILGSDHCSFSYDERIQRDSNADAAQMAKGIKIIDPNILVCPPNSDGQTRICPASQGGIDLYVDYSHLTDIYTLSLAPWLEKQLLPYIE